LKLIRGIGNTYFSQQGGKSLTENGFIGGIGDAYLPQPGGKSMVVDGLIGF